MSKIEEITQNQSYHEFNSKLSQAKYNISNLRKPNNYSKRTILLQPCQDIQPIKINKRSLQNRDNLIHSDSTNNKLNANFNNTAKFYCKLSQRLSVQTSVKKRRDLKIKSQQTSSSKRPNKTANSKFSAKELNLVKLKSDDSKSQKQFHSSYKNGIQQKYLKQAINSILIAYCSEQKFDLTMENAALKKFQIDTNSLLSQGMNKQNIHQLYKTLFIHSVSFNKLLETLVSNNSHLIKIVWKVYSILLQYSASGSFDSMIAEIERDKTRKLQGMLKQIASRQQIIENYDQLAKQKNSKIYKQLRYLREQNCRLRSLKSNLEQDLKRLQQSYDHQVSLRLKYESKFNEVHGACKQLELKHLRLTQRLFQLQEAQQGRKKIHSLLVDQNIIYRTETEKAKQQVQQVEQAMKKNQQALQKQQLEFRKIMQELITIRAHGRQLQEIISQKNREVQQYKLKYGNLQSCAEILKLKQSDINQQNQMLLKLNKQLYFQINDKRNQYNALSFQLKNYDQDKNKLLTNCQFQLKQNQHLKDNYQRLSNKNDELSNKIEQLEVELLSSIKLNESYKINQSIAQQTIKKLRNVQVQQQEKIKQYENKIKIFDQHSNQKDTMIFQLQRKNQDKRIQLACTLDRQKEAQAKVNLLQQNLQRQREQIKKKKQQYENQIMTINEHLNNTTQHSITKELTLQKLKAERIDLLQKWKNQKFERVAMQAHLKQTLTVFEIQSKKCNQLNKLVVQYKSKIQQLSYNLTKCKASFNQKQKLFLKREKQLLQKISKADKIRQIKALYMHPMLLEDAHSLVNRLTEKNQQSKKQFLKKIEDSQKQQKRLKNIIQSMQKKLESIKQSQDMSVIYLQEIRLKNEELIMLKRQEQSIKQQNKLLRSSEEKHNNEIKQKTKQLEQLIGQLEQVQDQNSQLKKQYTENYKIIQSTKVELKQIEDNYNKLNRKFVHIEEQRNKLIQEKISKQEQSLPSEEDLARVSQQRIKTKEYSPDSYCNSNNTRAKINTNSSQRTSQSRRKDMEKKVRNAIKYYQ